MEVRGLATMRAAAADLVGLAGRALLFATSATVGAWLFYLIVSQWI